MTTKTAKPSLKDLVSGKGEAVAAAVAGHAAARPSAPKHGKAAAKKTAKAPAAKKGKAANTDKEKKPTIASAMREAIMKGMNNADVFNHAKKVMGADVVTEDKKWFAAWYRADMKRKGVKNVPASKPSKE